MNTTTPGKSALVSTPMDEIEKLIKKFETQEIPHVEWLDKFVGKAIEKVHEEESEKNSTISLFIALPDFHLPVLFYQKACSSHKDIDWSSNSIVTIPDPELGKNNPVEDKHDVLSRGPRSLLDHDLKPNSEEKKKLEEIINYPPIRSLDRSESELLWKFRFHVRTRAKALTKFLKIIDWTKPREKKEALDLMKKWAAIDMSDALDLLSFQFKDNSEVRAHAVERLSKASDHEIQSYLLQLVQAHRYDKNDGVGISDLAEFLISRCTEASGRDKSMGIQFFWNLTVEKRNPLFKRILDHFLSQLSLRGCVALKESIEAEEKLVQKLSEISTSLQQSTLSRKEKAELFKKWLTKDYSYLAKFPNPIPLPMNPSYHIIGIKPQVHVFQSAQQPLLITFLTLEPKNGKNEFPVIFKTGDDLRQDQFVLQLIELMDELLKKENLDMKLIPYRALATSTKDGMVELVQNSKNVADVIDKYPEGPLRSWMREHHPDKDAPDGIKESVLDNFLRSCAGYCVITYILGIGDRHLDNLLITKNGELFHIDFGYILGRDPKPWPPPMKLSPEMVEGMGSSINTFKLYCCNAYNTLRKSSNLILNLISLMIDAGIEHINQGDKSVLKVQEKFKLELTDEQANAVLLQLIDESMVALVAQVSEAIHRWKKYWTKEK
eukprot:TRINITY_DN4021_c0_g1_i1.p1 TRINITY_DN4021_c0_g1~~TRINITY_DN4021_c0_g1_i1.p1  ORF type:complete len:663 (-),score=169.65 TRINITY_DN4021_c0_g1_i1:173-2161(-)